MLKKLLLLILVVGGAIYLGQIIQSGLKLGPATLEGYNTTEARIGVRKYTLFVADTGEKRTQGLSGVGKLDGDEGMLFVFETKAFQSFWMKEMNFPLDFIFVDGSRVVAIFENVLPDSYPNTISSESQADTVIELNSGEIARNGIEPGDVIRIK